MMNDAEKVLNLIMDWKSPKELEKPKRDERLCVERKVGELHICESQNLTLKTPASGVGTSSCSHWLTDFDHDARFHLLIVIAIPA